VSSNCMGCPHRANCRCRCTECNPSVANVPWFITTWPTPPKQPHRCPVCGGSGEYVPAPLSNQTTNVVLPRACHGCGGTGIVWG